MTLQRPLFVQPDVGDPEMPYSALETRALLDALVAEEGVISGLAISQRGAGANFSVDVAAGDAVIAGTDVANQGKYLCRSTALVNLATFDDGTPITAPGAGTRTHRVVAQVKDKLHLGSWSDYEWEPEILADTGSGTPDTPDSAISLGTIEISSGQTSITNADIVNNAPIASLVSLSQAQISTFVSKPTMSTNDAWVDFTVGTWPPVSGYVVPPSGAVKITIGAGDISNINAASATIRVAWRISGSDTLGPDPLDSKSVMKSGAAPVSASRTYIATGLTPGGVITVTPQWRKSSGSSGDITITAGQLIVEPA